MRIRELIFQDFRSFRGEHRISFVDPLTQIVRPVTVLAGTNGAGKTTILDTIEALLGLALAGDKTNELIVEARQTGLIRMVLEFSSIDLLEDDREPQTNPAKELTWIVHIVVGRWDMAPRNLKEEGLNVIYYLAGQRTPSFYLIEGLTRALQAENSNLNSGLLYFPHDRQLNVSRRGGPIQPPPDEGRRLLFRFSPDDRWEGSLEQLWVWQNYLDLEQGAQRHDHLKPFVKTAENLLGPDRPIIINKGRALAPAPWRDERGQEVKVRLDQLPSGEQQCLLLFGELARRRRPGVVIAIDEPEISLHPALQRLVVDQLRHFAREWDAQLILATHSPEVAGAVPAGESLDLDSYPTASLATVTPSPPSPSAPGR
jgi:predicted ATPase